MDKKVADNFTKRQRELTQRVGKGDTFVTTMLGPAVKDLMEAGKPVTIQTLLQWVEGRRTEIQAGKEPVDLSLSPVAALYASLERWLLALPPLQE